MHSIWAVATNTIKQALRMKIALVFVILLLVLLPTMGFTTTGDGTLKGRLQTFVSYGLSLTSFLLSMLTIFVSIHTVTSDLKYRQAYTVLTKPIKRYQFILGKMLGVLVLDTCLLVLFCSIIYGIAVYMPKYFKSKPAEIAQAQNEFFTSLAKLVPQEPDVTQEVEELYEKMRQSGQVPRQVLDNISAQKYYKKDLANNLKLQKNSIAPGKDVFWRFNNVKALDPNETLFIRYKYDVSVDPLDMNVTGRWFVGDDRNYGPNAETRPAYVLLKSQIRTASEIRVPASVIAKDGYLALGFLNDAKLNSTVVMFPEGSLEVLYKAGSFEGNFFRMGLMIWIRLVFLACLGLLASTFLSFPSAILLCMVVFCTGSISGFIVDSFEYIGEGIGAVYSYTVRPMIAGLPKFDTFNPTEYAIDAQHLSWSVLAKGAGLMLGIKGLLLLLLGLLIFTYKEIAKIVI